MQKSKIWTLLSTFSAENFAAHKFLRYLPEVSKKFQADTLKFMGRKINSQKGRTSYQIFRSKKFDKIADQHPIKKCGPLFRENEKVKAKIFNFYKFGNFCKKFLRNFAQNWPSKPIWPQISQIWSLKFAKFGPKFGIFSIFEENILQKYLKKFHWKLTDLASGT